MHKLLLQLLTRFVALALTFAVASCATLLWQILPALRSSPAPSARPLVVLVRADIETPMWPGGAAGYYWILRRSFHDSRSDIDRPVAKTDDNLITFNCGTLTVSVDEARRLKLNGDCAGSLNDPSALGAKLASIFAEREASRAYSPGMEYRTEIPAHERISRTVVIDARDSLRYGEILELANSLERAGANPIVLQTADECFAHPQVRRE